MNPYSSASAQIDDQPYALAEFHFHAPSENTINGQHYAMELHLTLSAGQLEKFRHTIHPANNRPVQPLNGRVIN